MADSGPDLLVAGGGVAGMAAAAHAARQGARVLVVEKSDRLGRLGGAVGGDPVDGPRPAHLRAGLPAG